MNLRANLIGLGVLALTGIGLAAACSAGESQANAQTASGRSLTAFKSDDELRDFLRRIPNQRRADGEYDTTAMPAPSAAPAESSASAAPQQPGITNTQEAGVDEGGIVKNYRDMLVILRRGKLFTVSLADGGMRPIASINAFPPDVTGQGDWYDEMLIAGDRVIVVGYSYARGGTEVNRFRISPDGQLRFEDAYHLRSNDYYSSRNYASRLIGNRLIFYTPLYLRGRGDDPLDALPGVRKWEPNGSTRSFNRIAEAGNVYIAPRLRDHPEAGLNALHSVITCDLDAAEMDCDATAVLGPDSRSFYVSGNAVYLFVSPSWSSDDSEARQGPSSYIYRLPFAENEKPTAIGARGAPVDQFSFREDPSGRLDVLVRASGGDAMFMPELSAGKPALLQVPLDAFGDGADEADKSLYRLLPAPQGDSYGFRNRFVGNYLLYGSGQGYGEARRGNAVYAAPVDRPGATELMLPHGVDRIEAMGSDAIVIGGANSDLYFSAVELDGREPALGARHIQRSSQEGETRSHAFFFSPDANSPDGTGTIGLPIAKPVEERYRRFFGSAASMLFLRRETGRFAEAGMLDSQPADTVDDGCTASCADWYGNARPIFLGGRVFALLGYELVEGTMRGGQISEVRRVNFSPPAKPSSR